MLGHQVECKIIRQARSRIQIPLELSSVRFVRRNVGISPDNHKVLPVILHVWVQLMLRRDVRIPRVNMMMVPIDPERTLKKRIHAVPMYHHSRPTRMGPLCILVSANPRMAFENPVIRPLYQFHFPHLPISPNIIHRCPLGYDVVVGRQRQLDILLSAMQME